MTNKELFLENYQNKGACENLAHFKKSFVKKFKQQEKNIAYYPWAVIERIFRLQGGKIKVEDWAKPVKISHQDLQPNENGELVLMEKTSYALFIHLSATWENDTLDEMYPLFDSQTAKVLTTPNAMNLNNSKQRGMVRLIARISGIGLDVFEQSDTSYEETTDIKIEKKTKKEPIETKNEKPEPPMEVVKKPKKVVKKPKKEAPEKPVAKEEPEVTVKNEFLKDFLEGKEVTIEPKEEEVTFDNESQEYAELLLEIRKIIKDKKVHQKAKRFVVGKQKELLSELEYTELEELRKEIE